MSSVRIRLRIRSFATSHSDRVVRCSEVVLPAGAAGHPMAAVSLSWDVARQATTAS